MSRDRLNRLRRILYQLEAMRYTRAGQVSRSKIADYHQQLDALAALGEDVLEFRIRDSDWSLNRLHKVDGVTVAYNGPLRGDEEPVVYRSDFERRFIPALRYVYWLVKQEEGQETMTGSRSAEVMETRKAILAELVEAYLHNQAIIKGLETLDGGFNILHPGLPTGRLVVERSHLDALEAEGLVSLKQTPSHMEIHIPRRVLKGVEQGVDSDFLSAPRDERIEQITHTSIIQHISGTGHNIAAGSSHFSQSQTHGVTPGDFQSLVETLRNLGVDEESLRSLEPALKEDEGPDGQLRIGKRVSTWILNAAGRISEQAIADGVSDKLPEAFNDVYGALQGFTG